MLLGDQVYLRLMEERDIPYKVKWINDPEVRATLNFEYPISEVATKQWLNKISLDSGRKDFIVCLKENDEPIGYAGFINIDSKTMKAEMYAGIGNINYWGKGLAQEVRKIQLEYGFKELGLNKIYTYNWVENSKMIHINEKFGFKVEGTLRQDVFSHGELRDRVVMGLLRSEYLKQHNDK